MCITHSNRSHLYSADMKGKKRSMKISFFARHGGIHFSRRTGKPVEHMTGQAWLCGSPISRGRAKEGELSVMYLFSFSQ